MKLSDFGLVEQLPSGQEKLYQFCGSPSFIAPEVFLGEGYREKCDVFSLGSVLYTLLTGRYLFTADSTELLFFLNAQCDLSSQMHQITLEDFS